MGRLFCSAIAVLLLASGCGNENAKPTAAEKDPTPTAPTPPPKPAYTAEDWRRDFASTYTASNAKTSDDGITSYRACFNPIGDKCGALFSGMKDGFRKVDHLTPPMTAWQESTVTYLKKSNSFIDLRIAASQCDEAVVVLNPVLHAKTWLFMSKVAFMADGDVTYEQTAEPQRVKRDTDDGRVWERWTFKLDPADFNKVQKFAAAKSKIIRLSGDKGYITMSQDSVDVFAKDVVVTIDTAQQINAALAKGGGPSCQSL